MRCAEAWRRCAGMASDARTRGARHIAARRRKAHDRVLASGQVSVTTSGNDYARWLGEEPDPRDLMRPFPAGLMRMWPISTRVKKPENDDALIVEPMELANH